LQLRHANPQIKELHIKYFGQLETAAKHPLDLSKDSFDLDQYRFLTTVPINKKIQLEQLGTYWIQSDSNSNDGLFVLCTSPYFANTVATSSRISCLQYLCNSEVYRAITLSSNPQEQLKNFWNTLKQNSRKKGSNTTELAAIYYDRLLRSNTLFSQIRKGCLTDKGMAFIVFGTPDNVFKWSNKELWYYNATKNRNPLELLFQLKSNEYQLKRSADLSVPYKRSLYNWLNIHTE
jgi:GWxTD domain-containing protein